jgi:hypothetical protein
MKAISLWQPWGSLWLSDRKLHETRHWPTSHRGPLLVHAAKKFVKDFPLGDPLRAILDDEFGGHWAMDLPTGALIGIVHLVSCLPTAAIPIGHQETDDYHCGDFRPDRYAWRRGSYRVFARPIPWKGAQGFFNVPDDSIKDAA